MNWLFVWLGVFIFNCLGAWVNLLNNQDPKWFWLACIISICPIFPFISRYSPNILIDGIVYDVIIFFAYVITLFFLGCAKTFTFLNWLGVILTVVGIFLLKVKL